MGVFSGSLNANELFGSLYNMIISQEVFADNLGKHQTLCDKARVDGGLYGDTKLYYSTDVLHSYDFLPYAKGTARSGSASTLLNVIPPDKEPKCQPIVLDKFRQIAITVDKYITKRAWMGEGAFAEFIAVMVGWLTETRKVIDGTNYNVFCGTTELAGVGGVSPITTRSITLSGTDDGQTVAEALANLIVEMGDYSRDFNAYGFLRSYSEGQINVIWNAKYANKIRKIDLPTIFHKEGLVDKLGQDELPARYFGTVITATNIASYSDATPAPGKPINSSNGKYTPGANHANGTIRCVTEMEKTIGGNVMHFFAGDEIPANATVKTSSADFLVGEVYIEDASVIGKVYVKLPPMMSSFETGTNFFNPQTLNENHYLTFGRNTLALLDNYPWVTLKKA